MAAPTDPVGRVRRNALLVLYAVTVISTVGAGAVQILVPPYLDAHGFSRSGVGQAVAVHSVAALAVRFVAGANYRPWRSPALFSLGCLMEAGAFFALSRVDAPIVITLLIAVNGAGFAFASTTALAALMDVTGGVRAGPVMAWYTGCIGLGHALGGVTGGMLGDRLGLEEAVAALAAVPIVAAVGFTFVIGRVPALSRRERDLPSQRSLPGFRARLGVVGPLVWISAAVALHINLNLGLLNTFFPLYGLAIGLSLTTIGGLMGLHSFMGAAIRFLAPAVFARADYRGMIPWMVVLSGVGVASLAGSEAIWLLTVAWVLVGLTRGLLRVCSAALATESVAGELRGAASSIYLGGLDLGKIVGPLIGGVGVQYLGYRPTFVLAGLAFPAFYLVLGSRLSNWDSARSPGPAPAPAPE